MKRAVLVGSLMTGIVLAAPAAAQENRKSFEEFRKEILSGYSDFRKTILDHYADFLNGEWHEYESLNGERRDNTPKPSRVPSAEPSKAPVSSAPEKSPQSPVSSPAVSAPFGNRSGEESFEFFGLPMTLPYIDFNISYKLATTSDYATQWKALDKASVAKRLSPAIRRVAEQTGLNDYLTYELVKAYINAKFPQADDSSRLSAIHYLLANLGYDARIAMSGGGAPMLLLPFKQTIYARNYMMSGNDKYYVFAPDGFDYSRLGREGIRTCTLPRDAEKGDKFDLVLGELKIPVSPKSFSYEYGPLRLTGEVNENLMPILYHYPQMPIADYAVSCPDPALRKRLVEQVRDALGNLDGDDGVEALLGFMHNVFDYATDEENHGFEKPYFLEETLYYPKNDCEDRAIFYTYLLWNALGREAQLVSFPGHEAATVRLENPVNGTAYNYSGKTFYISDPTFIGSRTGMVMPVYRLETPKVDYTYSR
ncbi:MAG: hypothetical protein K2M03_08585 [Muribaculaceae bacterium]|nr:hypothetical protein [Muribaculaceae bacterium]